MLRFACPLTAAATAIVMYCLERSLADVSDVGDWRDAYPLSARCFTLERGRETLVDLRAKLRLPEEYMPTEYHWLLLYECLEMQVDVLNDMPEPYLIEQLRTAADAREEPFLSLPRASKRLDGFHIDFDGLVDHYFWDTDFLLDAETFAQLDAEAKERLAYSADLFGVIYGLSPHPDELLLRRSEDV